MTIWYRIEHITHVNASLKTVVATAIKYNLFTILTFILQAFQTILYILLIMLCQRQCIGQDEILIQSDRKWLTAREVFDYLYREICFECTVMFVSKTIYIDNLRDIALSTIFSWQRSFFDHWWDENDRQICFDSLYCTLSIVYVSSNSKRRTSTKIHSLKTTSMCWGTTSVQILASSSSWKIDWCFGYF